MRRTVRNARHTRIHRILVCRNVTQNQPKTKKIWRDIASTSISFLRCERTTQSLSIGHCARVRLFICHTSLFLSWLRERFSLLNDNALRFLWVKQSWWSLKFVVDISSFDTKEFFTIDEVAFISCFSVSSLRIWLMAFRNSSIGQTNGKHEWKKETNATLKNDSAQKLHIHKHTHLSF